jgi:hypothetical protein
LIRNPVCHDIDNQTWLLGRQGTNDTPDRAYHLGDDELDENAAQSDDLVTLREKTRSESIQRWILDLPEKGIELNWTALELEGKVA